MPVTQYIGSRYVPLFADPAEWSSTKTYEPLTIVLHQGNSFTSKQFVPVGIEIDNAEYWAATGNYNAQVEQYRREVAAYREYFEQKPFAFATVSEMQNYEHLYEGAICHTNGFRTSGDGGAAWYVISATGDANSMDVLSCVDSLYATFIPTDTISPKMLGAYCNGANDDAPYLMQCFSAQYNDCAIEELDTLYIKSPINVAVQNNKTIRVNLKAIAAMTHCFYLQPLDYSYDSLYRGNCDLTCDCNSLATDGVRVDGAHYAHFKFNVLNASGTAITMRYTEDKPCGGNTVNAYAQCNNGTLGNIGFQCGQDDVYENVSTKDYKYSVYVRPNHSGGNKFGVVHGWVSDEDFFRSSAILFIDGGYVSNYFELLISDTIESVFHITNTNAFGNVTVKSMQVYNATWVRYPQYMYSFSGITTLNRGLYNKAQIYSVEGSKKLYNYLPYVLVDGAEVDPTTLSILTQRNLQCVSYQNVNITNIDNFVSGKGLFTDSSINYFIEGEQSNYTKQILTIPALSVEAFRIGGNTGALPNYFTGHYTGTTVQTLSASNQMAIDLPTNISGQSGSYALVTLSSHNQHVQGVSVNVANNQLVITFTEAITGTIRCSYELHYFNVGNISIH